MTAREHAARAARLLECVEATGKHPGGSALPRFADTPLLENTLLLANAHALVALALAATAPEVEEEAE